MSQEEKQVEVNIVPTDTTSAHVPKLATTSVTSQENTEHAHHHHHNCCHSDVSDNEDDTEPGLEDPVNEYDKDIDFIDHTSDRLTTIGVIKHCQQLTAIILRCNKLPNVIFDQLNECENLEYIDLYENRLTPIPRGKNPLENLKKLTELDVSFNELRFTRGFSGLSSLESLYLIQNKITTIDDDINTISDNLKILELGSNRIRVIENLKNFNNLEQLFLGRNKIANILPTSFENLPKLRILSLQSNRLTTIENIEPLASSLEELYLSHNGLKSINGVGSLKQLKILDASNNFLESIDAAEILQLENLEELWLNDNNIQSMDWLYKLKPLKTLRTIYLEHNPCVGDTSIANPSGRAEYITKISQILPQLTQIDAEYLS